MKVKNSRKGVFLFPHLPIKKKNYILVVYNRYIFMEFLPPYFITGTVFLLGLIIGSFLDVIACRFHTGKSINGRSRCMSCGNTLTWYELFPLFSYLVLRGRCKNCNGRIPARLFFIEILTAFLFLYIALHTISLLELAFGLVLSSVLLLIVLYDYNHMIIPNEFVCAVGTVHSLTEQSALAVASRKSALSIITWRHFCGISSGKIL